MLKTSRLCAAPNRDISTKLQWCALTPERISDFRHFNATIFPVRYDERFYADALNAPPDFARLAYVADLLVGAVCFRLEPFEPAEDDQTSPGEGRFNCKERLYIMTMGVLAPYREHGIGRGLLNHVFEVARYSPTLRNVVEIYLHVQVGNSALAFYQKFGFTVQRRISNYYRRIEPSDCYYVNLLRSDDGSWCFGENLARPATPTE